MVKTKKFILARQFHGEPQESDLQLIEEELPPLKDGEILCEALWCSVDPCNRLLANRLREGDLMHGFQVARIAESRNEDFPVGKIIVGYLGWQTLTVHDPKTMPPPGFGPAYILPDFGELPLSLALGVLGMPGNTAYFGFLEICQPKAGEVVVVSGAAGAVGSLVGQIARIKGCKVIGFAGSDDKVRWLKDDLHFDAAYNYKKMDVDTALKEAAPNGVDCYFDNVGGVMSSTILSHMNSRGRISVCGSISTYNADPGEVPMVPDNLRPILLQQLRVEGFNVYRWWDRWTEGIEQMKEWVKNQELVYRETVTEGFGNMPKAFIGMLRGENTGKAVVKC
ncbi:prostaglandin reductase 1 isoform X2 [Anabrus simplex]|uniref:prostaglandin reductase 1 isoform X1 n=1 Tax=Anabrus simplex TaxID=316456 RepID=UPI0035A29983